MDAPVPTAHARLHLRASSAEPTRLLSALGEYVEKSGLEPALLQLVWVRASQVNGCAYCLQLHTAEAIAAGERTERLFQLEAWAESPVFTERERAALAWTDAVTLVSQTHVPDAVFERARKVFSEKELVDLTWAVGEINLWNRLMVSFRTPPPIPQKPAAP